MTETRLWRLAGMASLAIWLTGCGGGETPDVPEPAEPDPIVAEIPQPEAQPPKTPRAPDPEPETASAPREGLIRRQPCDGSETCERLGAVSVGHGEAGIEVYFDPHRDDEITRWSRTIGGVISCVDGGRDLGGCVAASDASETCRSEFVRLADAGGDRAAFEAVFLTPGSPCRPDEEVTP